MKFVFIIILSVIIGQSTLFAQDFTKDVEQLYNHVKKGDQSSADALVKKLSQIDEDKLKSHLNTENKAKAFWINVYNTYVQYLLKKEPTLFKDRSAFFGGRLIDIVGKKLSLDDIEHGIIRRSKNKLSMGYLDKISADNFEKKFRLEKTDYRVHFALNCGAKSCPPVGLYVAERIEEQLDKSSGLYLKSTVTFDEKKNKVNVPKLCSWFKADFGGEDGTITMLHKYKIIAKEKKPSIDYLDYNWELSLSNYIDL